MEQMAVIAPSDLIEEGDLPPKFHRAEAEETGEQFSFDEAMEHVKADIIHDASRRYSCVADMARALDISESSVRQLLHKFGSK